MNYTCKNMFINKINSNIGGHTCSLQRNINWPNYLCSRKGWPSVNKRGRTGRFFTTVWKGEHTFPKWGILETSCQFYFPQNRYLLWVKSLSHVMLMLKRILQNQDTNLWAVRFNLPHNSRPYTHAHSVPYPIAFCSINFYGELQSSSPKRVW